MKRKPQARLARRAAIARLDHPNVVRFSRRGHDEGRLWILIGAGGGPGSPAALEHEGGSLPVDRAVRIVRGACEAGRRAHREGILHRDLKPENILIGRRRHARRSPIRLREAARAERADDERADEPLLYWYLSMAHERLKEQPAEPGSDVYAMGVILYEIIAGRSTHSRAPAR